MPTLGVDVVVFHPDGKLLLTRRQDFPIWCLPGGAVENGETLANAAIRETKEETGIDVRLTRLVGLYSRPYWVGGGDHVTVFTAVPVGGTLRMQSSEVTDIGYFAPDQLPDRLLAWHHLYIRDALQMGSAPVVRRLDVRWPFDPTLTREQFYRMRDNGELPPEQIAQFWSPLDPELSSLELDQP